MLHYPIPFSRIKGEVPQRVGRLIAWAWVLLYCGEIDNSY